MASGFGRGGRGAAIMDLLQKKARAPGESDESSMQPAVSAAPSACAKPMGRGAFMQSYLAQKSGEWSGMVTFHYEFPVFPLNVRFYLSVFQRLLVMEHPLPLQDGPVFWPSSHNRSQILPSLLVEEVSCK